MCFSATKGFLKLVTKQKLGVNAISPLRNKKRTAKNAVLFLLHNLHRRFTVS